MPWKAINIHVERALLFEYTVPDWPGNNDDHLTEDEAGLTEGV